ncbi:Glyoxalase/Bleomycin resistance protein/Dihydroxybiphenyl dioxygenase [Rhodotorula toruloides]
MVRPASNLPKISHVLELCLYARNLSASVHFYSKTLRLGEPFLNSERMAGFSLGSTTLLLFQRGKTFDDSVMPNDRGLIPGHGLAPTAESDKVKLKTHFALAVEKNEEIEEWEQEFKEKEVKILGKVEWPKGGKSLYFADPDGHVGELAARGIWPHW